MTAPPLACPQHGPAAHPDHRFCEVCGSNLRTGEAAPTPPQLVAPDVPAWVSSTADGASCAACGTTGPARDGYCDHCGRRRTAGRDRAELDLGRVGGVTDRARRRHNEDAIAIGRVDGATVAVVCDGVSTSPRADAASHAAADAGIAAVLAALVAGAATDSATVEGTRAAAAAARAVVRPGDGNAPPSCTYVSAVVTADTVTVGWIGDSRAYWLSPRPGESARLSIDDSVAGHLAAGRSLPAGAETGPDPRALIRWLGADSTDAEPAVVSRRPTGPGVVVICSDGLSHYLPEPDALAAAVFAAAGPPVAVARALTATAVNAGGHDNVAVAVLPFPPVEPEEER